MNKWIDKKAFFLFYIYLIGIFILLGIAITTTLRCNTVNYSPNSPMESLIWFLLAPALYIMSLPIWPIKIQNEKISVVYDRFPVFSRKNISLKQIKKLSITGPQKQKWDERATIKAPVAPQLYKYIRIEDINGKKYRNILFSEKEFKQVIKVYVEKNLIKKENCPKNGFKL